jgi:hypothetical protein
MDQELNFSLSYDQLTRFAEQRIRECKLDSEGLAYITASTEAATILCFWYELAINGYGSMNAINRKELIDADHQRLRKLIWPEADKNSCTPAVAAAEKDTDCAGRSRGAPSRNARAYPTH